MEILLKMRVTANRRKIRKIQRGGFCKNIWKIRGEGFLILKWEISNIINVRSLNYLSNSRTSNLNRKLILL